MSFFNYQYLIILNSQDIFVDSTFNSKKGPSDSILRVDNYADILFLGR